MGKVTLSKKIKRFGLFLIIFIGIFLFFNRKNSLTVLVRKIEVKDREVRKTVSASGLIKSSNQADLSFVATGKVLKINVEENQQVKKGELLAYLDSSVQTKTVQTYKDARDIKIRQKELFEEEKKSNTRLLGGDDSYNIKLREYEEALSQAEAQYQAQLHLLSNYYIYAPFDGVVIDVSKKEGEVATASVPFITIADLNDLIFEVVLDQEDYGSLKEGQEVEIELDAYEDAIFKGKVVELPLFANEQLGGFVVKILFESNGKTAKIGMTGDAFMITEKSDSDVSSLIFNEISYDEAENPFVWIIENGKVRNLPIEIGMQGDIYVEIKTDLSGKDIVVPATDNLEIKEGFKAKIIN